MPTIALVDDDRNILTSVSIALESEGYRVETYTDGASALDGLSKAQPDLAILDIKMPRMDGMELLRRLRQKTDMPVIFLTSKDDEVDELMGLRMGADDYIKKPFSQRLLIERIRAILRRELLVREANGAPGAACPSSICRSARKPASLPSISPAWMPPCTRITGNLRACAAPGSKTPLRVTTRTSCGRPSGVVPKFRQRTASGYASAKAAHKRSTSS